MTVRTFLCIEPLRLNYTFKPTKRAAGHENAEEVPPHVVAALNIVGTYRHAAPSQEARLKACYTQAREYEAARGVQFEWFVRTRPDNIWFGDAPALSTASPLDVLARARSLLRFPGRLTDDSMSWGFDAPQHHCAPPLPRKVICKLTATAQPCGIIDDQFAAVPRIQSERYFLRRPTEPKGARENGHVQEAMNASTVPRHLQWGDCCPTLAAWKAMPEGRLTRALFAGPAVPGSRVWVPVPARFRLDVHWGNPRGRTLPCHWGPCLPPRRRECS